MKNIWKWILGIVVVLLVVAGLVGLAFELRNRMSVNIVQKAVPNSQTWHGPMNGRIPGERGGPMWPGRAPRMGDHGFGRGFGPFAPGLMFFGMLGRLVPIAILILLLYGAYRLGKRTVPVTAAAAPAPPLAIQTHPCPKCQNPVQDDWKHCPICGETQ